MTFPPLAGSPAASVAAVALASLVAVAACSAGAATDAPRTGSSMSVATPATDAIDGWPLPGQASTTSFIPVLASAENVVTVDPDIAALRADFGEDVGQP
jgi:hypothetical protein